MIISVDAAKASDKFPFMYDKNSQQSGGRGNIYQHNKGQYDKHTANIIT